MAEHYRIAILLLGLTFSACNTDPTVREAGREIGDKIEGAAEVVADKTADAAITSAIKMRFATDKNVEALAIDVDTSDGDVTLTGTVKSKADADQAVMLAKSVEGVKNVTPRLTISSP